MKLATFLLGVLAVNAQTQDPRRKKWKDVEPTTVDWTTTTTTTSTESTTTTSTTTSTTARMTKPTTPPKLNLPSGDDALPHGTKELQTGMFGEQAADPDVAAATNHGFNFGSGLSTKGIGAVDETRGGKKSKKNKDKDKTKDKTKTKDKKDKKDKTKKDKPKKEKKPKEGKKNKKNKLTADSCFEAIKANFSMAKGVTLSGKSTNPKKPSFMYDCEGRDMTPSHKTITCEQPKAATKIGFKIVPETGAQPNGKKIQIVCKKKSATRSIDLSKCTPEEAHDAMDSFNFSSKEYLFDNVVAMPMRAEITASCNPKYVSEPPVGGVLLLECDGQPTIINNVLTYWKPSLTSVADFDTFNC